MMRILLLTHSFNSLSQRLYVVLRDSGHDVSVEYDINDTVAIEAVDLFQPDLIIAPFLKRAIPEVLWRNHLCLVVHPGIPGDRGPSALDWAILNDESSWGVTILQANAEMDAGDVWSSVDFPMRRASKASLYRNEVADAAVKGISLAIERFEQDDFKPTPLNYADENIRGQLRSLVKQADRCIDWDRDDTETVTRKILSADGFPGVLDELFGRKMYLYDARPEAKLRGLPGEVIARSGPAVCRATVDGAVWIGHACDKNNLHPFKLPATQLLSHEVRDLPEILPDQETGYREIWHEEEGSVCFLYFNFYNGAMNVAQCHRLRQAFIEAKQRDTKIIALMGGTDFWSNGMHLNCIEAAKSASDESWENINAIDDLALEIITTESHLTIAAMQGNAGAGGVFLARATDEVWAQEGVVLNPHYKDMGNLFGSEYWTYLLQKYAGEENAQRIIQTRLPMGVDEALSLGLVDEVIRVGSVDFIKELKTRAKAMAKVPALSSRIQSRNLRRAADSSLKPFERYRQQELEKMKLNFYGFDPSYHVARYNFVYKIPKSRTPITIAHHRDQGWITSVRNTL